MLNLAKQDVQYLRTTEINDMENLNSNGTRQMNIGNIHDNSRVQQTQTGERTPLLKPEATTNSDIESDDDLNEKRSKFCSRCRIS